MRKLKIIYLMGLALVVSLALLHSPATAQTSGDTVPVNDEAVAVFQDGLDAFEAGRYEVAYEYFARAYDDFPVHRRSTVALLMAGKALYRDARYEQAADVLSRLIDEYPSSGYVDEARRVRSYAEQQATRGAQDQVLQLGVVLPLHQDDATFAQAFFNGVHLAVQENNEAGGRQIRMLFRNTENSPDMARRAVRELAREGADVILGPLYSREAQAAAAAAESAGVVMIAPLATEEAVGQGRQYVFQANPTISMRGRIMARYAMGELGLTTFGVVGQRDNGISERMAEGFQREVIEEGGTLRFFHLLNDDRDWSRLVSEVGEDQFADLRGLYLPIAGGNAPRSIRGALNSLGGVDTPAQILGNAEWHDRNVENQASRYVATYTNDFYVDENRPEVSSFVQKYADRFQETPDQLTFTSRRMVFSGYDLASFVIDRFNQAPNPDFRQALRAADTFEGLGTRIRFGESNVNESMFLHRYRGGQIELVR